MKVLSLKQPWATLVVAGAKKFEVRSWQTTYRGPLLIHASAGKPSGRLKAFFEQADFFSRYIENTDFLPYGAIIGRVELVAIYRTEWLVQHIETEDLPDWQQEMAFDDYAPNRYAWKLNDAEALDKILPLKGTLGLWNYKGQV